MNVRYPILILMIIMSFSASAEYRVYQYIVSNKIQTTSDAPKSNIVLSSLNPVSFISYHGGKGLVNVDLVRTWMCSGYTGDNKKYCQSPYGELPQKIKQNTEKL